jgi:hypothetical protein
MLILGSPLYSQEPSKTFTLMAAKMAKILLECLRQVTGHSSGFYTTLELIQEIQIVLDWALSMIKKSLLLNIQV